ncbi:peptide methionine sulfoxide reductase [Dokdonia sp.]|uniref:peptide methionine sulfoxide reductase n=1 Tax=Dokdonia sp. TaxID=2024995 RepID=UPI003266FF1B
MKDSLLHIIENIPEGYSTVQFEDKKYGLTKTTFTNGKSYKIYAEELQGNDFISLNYYLTTTSELLKPCEMPEDKVTRFLMEMESL